MNLQIKLFVLSIIATFTLITFFNYSASPQQIQDIADLQCGFTADFQAYLNDNGYGKWGFDRTDLKCGAFGGKSSSNVQLKKIPVIFIHGNSDVAFGRGVTDGYVSWQTGFRSLATYLSSQGYQKSEMYTTTWGSANPNLASQNYHSKDYVLRVRAFIEAVLGYTKAKKINIVSHSMGVTLGRKAIKGGVAVDHSAGNYDVGNSLKDYVHSFVGIAGGNLGLVACWQAITLPTCSTKDGFFPGASSFSAPSEFLNNLNTNGGTQGDNVYTIWSKYDDLILYGCVVWGKITCRIPNQKTQVEKTTTEWGHFTLRDNTGPDMIGWL